MNLFGEYGIPEVPEASKNLPRVRGSVFPEYQPVAIHGDPIHPQNDLNFSQLFELVPLRSHIFPNVTSILYLLVGTLRGDTHPKKMQYECLYLQTRGYTGLSITWD